MKGMVTKGWVAKDSTGAERKFLEVITTGIKFDREGQRMAQTAVNDIMKAHQSGVVPAFSNHGISKNAVLPFKTYLWQDIIGKWTDANQEGENVRSVLQLNGANPDADLLWRYTVEEKMPVGFSIGGIVLRQSEVEVPLEDDEDGQ